MSVNILGDILVFMDGQLHAAVGYAKWSGATLPIGSHIHNIKSDLWFKTISHNVGARLVRVAKKDVPPEYLTILLLLK